MPKNCLEKQRDAFIKQLQWEEKSDNTIAKYRRDIRNFCAYLSCGQTLDKQTVLAYKQHLLQKGYKSSSINSMLVALNRFLVFTGRENCQVKLLKRQRPVFRTHERELSRREYWRLLQYAKSIRYTKAVMPLQTICATGIRVSELAFISVEALHTGEASIVCKGKTRQVAIVLKLRQMLLDYCQSRNLRMAPFLQAKAESVCTAPAYGG